MKSILKFAASLLIVGLAGFCTILMAKSAINLNNGTPYATAPEGVELQRIVGEDKSVIFVAQTENGGPIEVAFRELEGVEKISISNNTTFQDFTWNLTGIAPGEQASITFVKKRYNYLALPTVLLLIASAYIIWVLLFKKTSETPVVEELEPAPVPKPSPVEESARTLPNRAQADTESGSPRRGFVEELPTQGPRPKRAFGSDDPFLPLERCRE